VVSKRKNYLINPRFQIKFSLYVCILLFISSLIYPFTIYDIMTEIINHFGSREPNFSSTLVEKRRTLLLILSVWQFGYTALVFIICIFFSHKIAGPIYKMQTFLSQLKDSNGLGKLQFRKGDYFQDLAEDFNEAMANVQETYKKDFVYLSEVNAYLNNLSLVVPEDKKVILSEINKKLSEIQDRFNNF
jgi:hypothetical protein